tara:strand:+ start:964 stop:1878 length:915 start_codon:yes stop_codon:yes gene_type:complete
MRKIRTKKEADSFTVKKPVSSVYCTVDGSLTPVVYTKTSYDNNEYYESVSLTGKRRLKRQKSLKRTRTTNKPIQEGSTTIQPILSFYYDSGLKEITSGNNLKTWASVFSSTKLTMPVTSSQPDIGLKGTGNAGSSAIYFNRETSDYMTLSSPVTITGDFTMFFYIEPIAIPNHKNYRLLGKSDDNDMYLSIGEAYNESYNLSFSSSSEVVVSTTGYWQPSSKKLLVTVQRSNNKIYIRENGTQVFNGVIPTTDFTFDQIGKIGNISIPTFNGSIYHFSVFDGYIITELESLENSIIKKASLAKG